MQKLFALVIVYAKSGGGEQYSQKNTRQAAGNSHIPPN
jgi:hypothetical protein